MWLWWIQQNRLFGFIWILLPFSSFAGEFYDVQPRLQPIHWRLLEDGRHRPTTRDTNINQSVETSIYLSSAVIRQLESNPLPSTSKNASSGYPHLQLAPRRGGKSRRVKRESEESAALSKNITKILEDLLRGYDKTERPSFKQGSPTRVKVNILIRSMGPISEEDMNYSMDCYFRQYWRDERLGFTGLKKNHNKLSIDQLSLNVKMLEKIWKPDTYFHNGLSSYLHTITRPNKLLRISEHGDITYSMRLTIKAKCPMMLRSFPMDWQSCPLVIGSFAYNAHEVEYIWKKPADSAVDYEGKLQLSQFDIKQTEFRGLNFSRGNNMGTYSVLQVVIALQRHTGYFLIQIYLPCTLLVVLSWVGFWLNREATSDRVGLGITTVLTLSTIALESRTDLPKVHYATALDWFIICSFGYCIATLLEFAGVHYFTKVGSGEVFSITEDLTKSPECEEDEWQDVEVSEEWGPQTPMTQTPMTPLNDEEEPDAYLPIRSGGGDNTRTGGGGANGSRNCTTHSGFSCGDLGIPPYSNGSHAIGAGANLQLDYIDDRYDSFSDDCTECAQLAATAPSAPAAAGSGRCPKGSNCMADTPLLSKASNGQCQATPPPPPRPAPPPQPLRCSSLANNYAGRQQSTSGMPNSYSMASSSIVSQQWKGHATTSEATGRQVTTTVVRQETHGTQTESKMSCFRQFLFCLLANEKYRRTRQIEAARSGSTNSTSRIDSVARMLFPLSFGLFNMAYWYSYFQAQKPFDWGDHMLKGNTL